MFDESGGCREGNLTNGGNKRSDGASRAIKCLHDLQSQHELEMLKHLLLLPCIHYLKVFDVPSTSSGN